MGGEGIQGSRTPGPPPPPTPLPPPPVSPALPHEHSFRSSSSWLRHCSRKTGEFSLDCNYKYLLHSAYPHTLNNNYVCAFIPLSYLDLELFCTLTPPPPFFFLSFFPAPFFPFMLEITYIHLFCTLPLKIKIKKINQTGLKERTYLISHYSLSLSLSLSLTHTHTHTHTHTPHTHTHTHTHTHKHTHTHTHTPLLHTQPPITDERAAARKVL